MNDKYQMRAQIYEQQKHTAKCKCHPKKATIFHFTFLFKTVNIWCTKFCSRHGIAVIKLGNRTLYSFSKKNNFLKMVLWLEELNQNNRKYPEKCNYFLYFNMYDQFYMYNASAKLKNGHLSELQNVK